MKGLLGGNLENVLLEDLESIGAAWPAELNINDIALFSTDNPELQQRVIETLEDLCKTYQKDNSNGLPCSGFLKAYEEYKAFEFANYRYFGDYDWFVQYKFSWKFDCFIHRDDFKKYLKNIGDWPLSARLAHI